MASKFSSFVQSCVEFTFKHQSRLSISPAYSNSSHISSLPSQDTDISGATSVSSAASAASGSAHAVSDFEATSYYYGISDNHPLLLYRTGNETYPFVKPKGSHGYRSTKSVRGVYGTPLNALWSTVGPLVLDLINTHDINYSSIDVARFVTHDTDKEDLLGPVVIWVGIYPGSTTADTAHNVSQDILALLKKFEIEGIEVEWRESLIWRAVSPPLLRIVGNSHPTVDVRGPLTATLGIPVATAERPDAQGSVGFFFHEGRDNQGISDRVLAVTCRHVLFETTKTLNVEYDIKTTTAPPKHVRLHGVRRFQRCLEDIKYKIALFVEEVDIHERWIKFFESKEKNEDPKVVVEEEEDLGKVRRASAKHKRGVKDLESFYLDTVKDWGDSETRNIGTIDYSPPISFSGDERYTEDWGAFALHEDRWKAVFQGNVLDLGTAIPQEKLKYMMCSPSFKYPLDRQLRIKDIVPEALLVKPDLYDENDLPCLLVIKNGNTTGLTLGHATGMESFVRVNADTKEYSTELAIFNRDMKSGVFSAKGDSGSLVVDALGRMVGLLHAGTCRGGCERSDVTYVTPMHFLWPRIRARYEHAELNGVSWSAA